MQVAPGVLPPATLVHPCTSTQGSCVRTPLWSERGSRSYLLSEEQVRARANPPRPGQAIPEYILSLLIDSFLNYIQYITSLRRRPVKNAGQEPRLIVVSMVVGQS